MRQAKILPVSETCVHVRPYNSQLKLQKQNLAFFAKEVKVALLRAHGSGWGLAERHVFDLNADTAHVSISNGFDASPVYMGMIKSLLGWLG